MLIGFTAERRSLGNRPREVIGWDSLWNSRAKRYVGLLQNCSYFAVVFPPAVPCSS